MSNHLKFGIVILLLGLAAAFLTIPVVGQGVLQHFTPRQVNALPATLRIAKAKPFGPRLTPFTQLEQQAGFPLLLPTFLPDACALQEQFYLPEGRQAVVNYACVSLIQEQAGPTQRPRIGAGSLQEIEINGRAGLYIRGAWVKTAQQSEPQWLDDFEHTLVFEKNGVLVQLSADPSQVSKAELVRIAVAIQ